MNTSEKRLIECLINREDRARHDAAVRILFYSREKVSIAIRKAVTKCFSGSLYYPERESIYDTFVGFFYKYLITIRPETLRAIDELDRYFYRAAWHFANKNRRDIDTALGVNPLRNPLPQDDRFAEGDDGEQPETDSPAPEGHHPKQPEADESSDADGDGDAAGTPADWASRLLSAYINRIPNALYREVLLALDIEGLSAKQYAQRIGKSSESVDMMHSRARTALTQAALGDILPRCRGNFVRFRHLLTSSQAETLQAFFESGQLGDARQQERIASAYKALAKKSLKALAEEETDYKRNKRNENRQSVD